MMKRIANHLSALIAAALLTVATNAPATAQATEPADAPAPDYERVRMETALGPIVLDLDKTNAPITTGNFLRYVREKRFDGTAFYRAMRLDWGTQPNGLVQGGTKNDPKRILPPIAHEPTNETGILHKPGTISMARYDPGTATGDFSIMLSAQPGLDAQPDAADPAARPGFAAFGHVVVGMDVVRAIFDAPISETKGEGFMRGQMIEDPVTIVKVSIVDRAQPDNPPAAPAP